MIETTSSKLNKIKVLFRLLIVWNKQILLKTEDNDFYEKQKNHVCERIFSDVLETDTGDPMLSVV